MNHRALYALLAFVFLTAAAHAEDAERIDYRRHVMRTLGEHSAALQMIAQKKAPAENFKLHVRALALASTQALKAFEPHAEGGNAKAEVWKNWPDFSARLQRMVASLAELEKVTDSGGVTVALPKLKGAGACQGCHDVYMARTAPVAAPVEPDAVKYRHHIMNAIDAQSSAVGQILSMEITDGDLASNFGVLAATAAGALKAFEPKVPGGEAKPEVWTQWADFSLRMNAFARKTADAARVAREQGNEAALPSAMEALMCKNCHDTYRAKK